MLHEVGLLAYLLPEADRAISNQGEVLLGSLSRLDDYRNAGLAAPDQLTNAIVMGTLLVPLGVPLRRVAAAAGRGASRGEDIEPPEPLEPEEKEDVAAEIAALGAEESDEAPERPSSLVLPFARRDLDRLRLILAAQSRLREVHTSPRVKHLLAGRGYLDEALRWLEIHGGVQGQELAAHWRSLDLSAVAAEPPPEERDGGGEPTRRPRRRRRRRPRRRPGPPSPPARPA
jgi:hypothetical protein